MADYVQLRNGLVVPAASFAEPAAAARPEAGEIASIQRDTNRVMFGGVLENLDDTLRTRGQGRGLKIYELERDCKAFECLQKRKLAVTSRPWQVDAASDAAIDKAAADLVTRVLAGLGKTIEDPAQMVTGFDQTTANFLDATLKGYAVGEVMWSVVKNELHATRIIARDQRRFHFGEDLQLRLITRENLRPGELLPPRKFIVHRFGAKDDAPHGLGMGSRLFWPVFFKRQGITFWLTFADKFGSPTAIGKYPPGSSTTEQAKLLEALAAIAQDAGIIVPDGMLVEFLEAARTGSIDTYEKLARYMDEQISLAVLGEIITGSAKSTGLGSGVADVGNSVRLEIAKADADMLSDTLNATLVRWLVDYNLPGAAYPTLWRNFEEEDDLQKRAEVDKSLHEMGYEPESIEQINDTYGGRWRKKAAAQPVAPARRGPGVEPAFAEAAERLDVAAGDQLEMDAAVEAFGARWQELLGPRVDELVALAESTGDLVTFRERLAELLAGAPAEVLVEALARGGFAAQLLGRTADDRPDSTT